mgnify:CR=1 FL=1
METKNDNAIEVAVSENTEAKVTEPKKKRGRKPKDYVVSEESQITELKYIITRKEARIKQLEMENELMRDFLSLTERK